MRPSIQVIGGLTHSGTMAGAYEVLDSLQGSPVSCIYRVHTEYILWTMVKAEHYASDTRLFTITFKSVLAINLGSSFLSIPNFIHFKANHSGINPGTASIPGGIA